MNLNLTNTAVRRPITILMILGFGVLAGAVAFTKLPVRRLPNVSFPFVRVVVSDPGATAATVAQSVTGPVEKALSVETGVVSMVGTSAPGRSQVALQFTGGTNVDAKASAIALDLAKIARALPATASAPSIIKANPSALPILDVAVTGALAPSQLYTLATTVVAPAVQEVSGVADVAVVGGRAPAVTVTLSPTSLTSYGVSITQVLAALRAQNTSVAAGTTVVGSQELRVSTVGGYPSVAALQALPVASRGGATVVLGQLGSVSQGLGEAQSNATLDGQPAVGLVVTASSTADSLAVDSQIRSTLSGLTPQLPPGVTTAITGDVTTYVRAALSNVELDLFLGILIAGLVLALFLHRLANTIIVMLAIPVSLITTFAVMYFLGFSLDLISLMALSLLIGILVDDSIVVLENIGRHRAMGKSPELAAIDGRTEIGAAAVAITLTDVVVYAPVAFVSGNVGQLFREFGLTIVAATLLSLLVSFTLTPMLASRWLGRERSGGWGVRFGRRFDAGFDRLRARYRRVIAWSLRHRPTVLGVAALSLAGTLAIVASGVIPTTFVPAEDNGVVTINASLPVGTPLTTSQATLASFASRLQHLSGVRQVFVSAGFASTTGSGHNLGQLSVDLAPRGTRPAISSYVKEVDRLARRYPGLVARAHVQSPFIAGGARAAAVNILGPDLATLDSLAAAVSAQLAHNPAVSQVSTSVATPTPELALTVNQSAAAYFGVSAATIGATVAADLGGTAVPPLVTSTTAPSEPITVAMAGAGTMTPGQLASLPVATGRGDVPLGALASLSAVTAPAQITQINREYAVSISASAPGGNTGPATAAVLAAARSVGLPTGYALQVGGQAAQQQRAFGPLIGALALSVLLIYMLMAALYESFTDPLAILLSVPLATVGAFGALWASGLPLSIFALLALIMLLGLVSKNAILLVDYTKTLRKRGQGRDDAVVESGATRIRPILMTTATLVAAMLPLALGTGSGSSERAPISIVLIGGLLSSTVLTLLVVPVLYTVVDDAAQWLARAARSLRSRTRHRAPASQRQPETA
ncbi:MAG: efflux RND transporter permease subunit [Mycobacteriales bacterium]